MPLSPPGDRGKVRRRRSIPPPDRRIFPRAGAQPARTEIRNRGEMTERSHPPFRADHVGSFLRPDRLMAAVRARRAGGIGEAELRTAQDAAIRGIVAFQESLGLGAATDGEFRRRGWSAGFIDAVDGFGLREGAIGFRAEEGGRGTPELSPYARERLRRTRPIVADDFAFLRGAVTRAVPKITMPSPPVMHYFLGPRAVDERAYPDIEEYFADLSAIYREEVRALEAAGCTYLQLDDTALPCHCDESFRSDVASRGEDPEALAGRYVELINAVADARSPAMRLAVHMCRGNLKGSWMAEGGYEPIAETVFSGTRVDAWFMEYDTDRAGGFEPLRFMPEDRVVVLGLVSTKTPVLESRDELKRRVDAAARYVPLERLCLSPQCGFSSAPGRGQAITEDDQKRKLSLVVETAAEIWGGA